jgi:hypothetical protein
MSSFRVLRYLAGGAALAAIVVACSDSTGPGSLANPTQTSAAVASIDSSFATPVFRSFAAVGSALSATGPAAAAPIGGLLWGTLPHVPGLAGRAFSNAARARALQRLAPALSLMASPSGIFPDSVRGKTFTYNCAGGAYIRDTLSGADANGIRILLYAVDTTATIVCPATEVGYVDIIDVGSATVPAVRFVVKSANGTVTYVDYTVSGHSTSTSFTASVAGYVTDGSHRLDFAMTVTGNLTGVTANATLDNNAADAHVALYERITQTTDGLSLTVDYRITHGGESVRLSGSLTVDTLGNVTAHFTIQAGGGTFATITATPSDTGEVVTFTGPGGRQLTADELAALGRLFEAPQDLFDELGDLVNPAGNLIGFGGP